MPNEGDRFGHFYTADRTLAADAFVGGSNLRIVELTADGDYVYNGTSEKTITFIEKMKTLIFESNNSLRKSPGLAVDYLLKNRIALFSSGRLDETDTLRDMEDDFGIIPMPKYDEYQENYTTYSHDGSSAFLIPITNSTPDTTAAVLEAMAAETYRTVTPAYFEIALKEKYSRDDESSRMLDIIIEGNYPDVGYIYGLVLNKPINIIRIILASETGVDNAMSTLASNETVVYSCIDTIIEKFDAID